MISKISMASTSQPIHTIFDVFLSFRGEDTRYSFTDHLFHALKRSGLRTFRDDDEIERGEELKPEIETAIIKSRASIVVLSKNYATSKWCLDELWLILEQRRKNNHFVLPVFYHVDPSDVRNQRQSFAIEVDEVAEASKWTKDSVIRWKAALAEVANLTGMVVSGSEQTFITEVVNTVNYKLDLKQVSTPAHLTGMESRAEVINSWLKDEQSSTNVLAICGMGGGGKTTLAQYIYNLNKQNFESSSFVEEIGKQYKQPHGLIGLQTQLLEDVLGVKSVTISSVSQGTHKIQKALQMIRVLIILDDVDDEDELSTLLGIKTFHSQSKIIITTRILGIDSWFGSLSWSCWVCELELLNDPEALELLSWYSFGFKTPMKGFEELAAEVSQYCEGNPLALKVLGSSLFVSDKDPSASFSMIEIWKSRLNSMKSLKGDIHSKIQGVLQRSFDSLPYNNDKELFLHIACFFEGHLKDDVVEILEDDLHAKSGITTLINRCLLTVSVRRLKMHQLLQDMGRKMIRDESKDPAERSRVWCSDDAYHVLSKGNGSVKIEGLSLDSRELRELKKGKDQQLALKTESLIKMKNLKLLELIGVELFGSYKNFPDLRWLRLCGCQLKTVPLGLLMSSLVALEISEGSLERFELPKVLDSLKILNLKGSSKLVSICGFSQLPKLETLILRLCTSLTYVCKTIGYLKNLHTLDLSDSINLWKASSNGKFVNQPESLKSLCCGGILKPSLLYLPLSLTLLTLGFCDLQYNNDVNVVFHTQSFFILSLRCNPFEYLPDSINLKCLQALDLTFCPNLKSLPCLPSTLQELYINWCTSLERITFQSACYSLQEFAYEGCFSLSEIQGLFKLVSIEKIDEADLGDMHWLKSYQDHTVDLVGDDITKGRIWHIQMLYEYGIRSTFLQGIKDENMMTYEYTSSSYYLSFRVPLLQEKHRIQGLNTSFLYRSPGEDKSMWLLFAIVRNITKGLTFAYNPVVYCKPKVDEDVVWLSYWPIGNILDEGDEVEVELIVDYEMIISGCGASLVYMGDGEVEQNEKCENNTREEEVIGGDLSEFEVTIGGYYLCRRDLFMSTLDGLKMLFGDNIQYTYSEIWRKSRRSIPASKFYLDLKNYKDSSLKKIEVGVSFSFASELEKIGKAVLCLVGVSFVSLHEELGRLYVYGCVDPETVETCVEKYDKMAKVLNIQVIHYDFQVGLQELISALSSIATNRAKNNSPVVLDQSTSQSTDWIVYTRKKGKRARDVSMS